MNTLKSLPEQYDELYELLDEKLDDNTEVLNVRPEAFEEIARREPLLASLVLAYSLSGFTEIECYEEQVIRGRIYTSRLRRVRLIR